MTANKKKTLIAVGVALACIGAAYGGGRWQGHVEAESVRDDLAAARREHQAKIHATRKDLHGKLDSRSSQLADCNTRAARLDARRHLHRAERQLVSLNFGLASAELATTGKKLAAAAGDDAPIAKLAQRIADTRLEPTRNLEELRKQLGDIAEQFDKLVPPKK